MTYTDGIKYDGEFKDGKKHVHGTMTWTNGDKYEGAWKMGVRHGQGTFTFGEGDSKGQKYAVPLRKESIIEPIPTQEYNLYLNFQDCRSCCLATLQSTVSICCIFQGICLINRYLISHLLLLRTKES